MDKVQVMFAMGGNMKRAGAETMIMQYLRQLVKDERLEFSVLVHGYNKGDYDDEIAEYNVPMYHVPVRGQHPLIYSHEVKKVLRAHPVDIINCNMDSACGDFLEIAQKCGIENRIAHSHTTRYQTQRKIKKLIGYYSKKKIHQVATGRFACSQKAGEWLFEGDSFEIVKNAIDLDLYYPRDEVRKRKRAELGITDDSFVVGHVGRFCYEKNHRFLLKTFARALNSRPKSKLVLAGTGTLLNGIKSYANELQITENVLFLGLRRDIPELLQTMDVFVMPSLFEGLPVSGIEAQAAGLPCLFADTITPEICMTEYANRLPLDDVDRWVETLEQTPKIKNADEAQRKLKKSGYDIVHEAHKLADCYLRMCTHNE